MAAQADSPSPEELASLLLELDGDPAAAARFRALAGDSHDPLATLRWRVHPRAVGARGESNPRLVIPSLEQIVHARPTDDPDRERIAAATAELRAVLSRVAEEDRTLDRALALFAEERSRATADEAESEPEPREEEGAGAPKRWFGRPQLIVLCAIALVAAVLGIIALAQPRSSLAIFDRPQTAEEAVLEDKLRYTVYNLGSGTGRILTSKNGVTAMSFLSPIPWGDSTNDYICVTLSGVDGRPNACAAEEAFRESGIDLQTTTHEIRWGPTGDAVLTERNG